MTNSAAGIYITQAGVSVPRAADYQFVFNSNWPSLQAAFDQTITLPPNGTLTLPHGLIFPPLTIGTLMQGGISLGRIFAPSQNFQNAQVSVTMSFDAANVYLANTDVTNTYQVNVVCYNLDITQAVNYTLPQFPAVKQPYDNTTGVKVTKINENIKSTDLRNFILHSRAQSPAVLAVVTQTSTLLPGASQGTIAYLNPVANAVVSNQTTPYIPWTFAFYSTDGKTYQGLAPGFQQSGASFQLLQNINAVFGITSSGNGAVLNISTLSTGSTGSIVVLRDPLTVPTYVEVMY